MNRPTDTFTGKVLAELFGKANARCEGDTHREGTLYFWTDDTPGGYGPAVLCKDPRDYHETAMELLHWLIEYHGLSITTVRNYMSSESFWALSKGKHRYSLIPISGHAFRYAVVELAAQVMEIKDD